MRGHKRASRRHGISIKTHIEKGTEKGAEKGVSEEGGGDEKEKSMEMQLLKIALYPVHTIFVRLRGEFFCEPFCGFALYHKKPKFYYY